MKRYFAFYGDQYYPYGGMNDFRGDFDTIEEAKKAIDDIAVKENRGSGKNYWSMNWAHIYDTVEKKKVISIGNDVD